MKKAIIYYRKSTDRDDKQANSLEHQLWNCKRTAKNYELDVIEEIWESKSAKLEWTRDWFNKLLKLCKTWKIDYIIIDEPKRLSRNNLDSARIIDLFDKSEEAEGYYINALIYIENIKSEDKNTTSKKVLEYVGKAAKHFYKPAVMNLAQLYEKAKDYKEAVYWYERALGKELFTGYQRLDAYYKVGYYYKEGLGVEKDYAKAKESFEYVIAEELKLVDEMDKENYSKANYELEIGRASCRERVSSPV